MYVRGTDQKRTASHFIEFSGVTWPNCATVTVESCALLKRSSSAAVPQYIFPFALKCASKPVPWEDGAAEVVLGAEEETVVGGGGAATDVVAAPGRHCE